MAVSYVICYRSPLRDSHPNPSQKNLVHAGVPLQNFVCRTFERCLPLEHEVRSMWPRHSVGVLHLLEGGRGGGLEGLGVQDTLGNSALPVNM